MSSSINLVSNKNEQLEKELRLLLVLRVISVSMLITIAFVSIGAFIFSATIPLSQIKKDQETTITSISALHSKLTSYYLVRDRINNINNLLKNRQDFTKPLTLLLGEVNSDIEVQTLVVEKKVIKVEVSSSSLINLNKMIDNLFKYGKEKKVVSDVQLESLGLNAQRGKYSVSMSMTAL